MLYVNGDTYCMQLCLQMGFGGSICIFKQYAAGLGLEIEKN